MGLRKYRSVEDMPGPSPRPPLDPENLRLACGLSGLAQRLSRTRLQPGVRKFPSWDDALRAREGKHPEPGSGFEPFPRRGPAVSNELIDRLREDEPD